ncbi:MAG: DUF3617 family protein [Pseudorhodoplanes sp.]
MSVDLRGPVALLLLLVAHVACADTLEPGRWRVVTTTLSGPPTPPQVANRCLTPEDVKDLGKTFGPQVSTVNSECTQTEFKLEPAGLSWRLQCRGQLDMDVAGQFIFESPTHYSALITTQATMMDRMVQQTMMTIAAQRTGACE